MKKVLEICANSVQSAINAEIGGANRVELCENLWEGGTTPSAASIQLTRQHINIGLFVLIRPRGGDFVYSELEYELIKNDIKQAKTLGADGIVSGVLLPDGNIDINRTGELVELSKPLPFTFHRAFDMVENYEKALEDIIICGVQRLLTSGLANSSLEGVSVLKELNKIANKRITIMPGGGITPSNILYLERETNCFEFHASAKSKVLNHNSRISKVKMNGSTEIPEDYRFESSAETIAQIILKLNED